MLTPTLSFLTLSVWWLLFSSELGKRILLLLIDIAGIIVLGIAFFSSVSWAVYVMLERIK